MTRRYKTASALRRALDDRLLTQPTDARRDRNWLRRRIAFSRMLVRLVAAEPDAWVLKGGMAVELRRPGTARSTRDVDVILRHGLVADPSDETQVREAIATAFAVDVDHDEFAFSVRPGRRLRDDSYGRPAWRFPIIAELAGREFSSFKMDVVAGPEEVEGGTELRELPDVLDFAGIPTRTIIVADLRQQYAEKLHALTRSYLTGESTRVKDLIDLVLLIEDGVTPDTALKARVRRVFAIRQDHELPTTLGSPPTHWEEPFQAMAHEIRLIVTDYRQAHDMVAAHWASTRAVGAAEDS